MVTGNMPAREVDIDADLVARLVADQFPDLAGRPVAELANGWDNCLFRLGDDLVARLPRRQVAVELMANELRWLPGLVDGLPLPTSAPLRAGAAGRGYPWPWAICSYLPGSSALEAGVGDPLAAARALGEFLSAWTRPAPADAPVSPFRGGPLADRHPHMVERLDRLGGVVDADHLRGLWLDLSATPPWSGPRMWVHGDIHPGNLVVADGRMAGVVDFGDLNGGDPATDLLAAWTTLPLDAHDAFRSACGWVDDDSWRRGRAWGLYWGLAVVDSSADNPAYAALGRRVLAAVS